MPLACGAELALGLRVALGPADGWLAALQLGMIGFFTAALAWADPMLLAHPFGVLSKNLPLAALILVGWRVERDGWTPGALWLLRAGMAAIWLTEGIVPKIIFQQPMERAVVAGSGLVPIDPGTFLVIMGLLQAASGVAALVLRGRPLRLVLCCQLLGLVFLPLLVAWQDPLLWVHPFGPLTKNVPILAGTWLVLQRVD